MDFNISLNEHGAKMNAEFVFEQALAAIKDLPKSRMADLAGTTVEIRMNPELVGVPGFKIGEVTF